MKTIIHINQHIIKKNRKTGSRNPVITVKNYKENKYCKEVLINGPVKIVYSPDKPLKCGAVCWVETTERVITK